MKDLQWFPPIPEPRTILAPKVMGSLIVAASVGGPPMPTASFNTAWTFGPMVRSG